MINNRIKNDNYIFEYAIRLFLAHILDDIIINHSKLISHPNCSKVFFKSSACSFDTDF